jgi:predicted dehydrogenase
MLDTEKLDIVQVTGRNDRIPVWSRACLERHLPVVAEKPLAMDLATLADLFAASRATNTPIIPMHTMRGDAQLAAIRGSVRGGEIGQPLLSFSQKTYRWGSTRPEHYRSRQTFPGIAPWVGIHAFDWLHWILGDVFTEVVGRESSAARPEYPACASHATFMMTGRDNALASLTFDYLRPKGAPSHADERIRIAGTRGVIESALEHQKVTLITNDQPPRDLALIPRPGLFTQFARSLTGQSAPPLTVAEAFRITEIAIKAQQATDTKRAVSLLDSPYV